MKPYFIWKNINSIDMGIVVNKLPPIIKAEKNIEKIEVLGRNGFLTKNYKTYKSYIKPVECTIKNINNIDRICTWLDGSSDVVFSNECNKLYKATIVNQIPFERVIRKYHRFIINFECQPLKYSTYDTEKLKIVNLTVIRNQPAINPLMSLNYNGGGVIQANTTFNLKEQEINIHNNGTLECKPLITVCGSGDITLHIKHNNSIKDIILKNIEDSVTINSEIEECYKEYNGIYTGQNNKLYSDFPVFSVGESEITWEGNVQLIKIKKNECYL